MATESDHFEETDEPRPWHRQRVLSKNIMRVETAIAYELLKQYLALDPKRSHVKLSKQVGKSRQYIERLSARWKWMERSRAYDSFVTDEEMAAFIGGRKAMARRQAQLGVLGQNIAATSLLAIQQQLQTEARRRMLKPMEKVRLLDVSSKLERVSRGENDEDQVASIIVHISRQTEPRWKSEGWSEDGDTPKLA